MDTTYRPLPGPIRQFLLNNQARGVEPSTQRALAEAMGTTPVRLNRILKGHLPLTWDFGHRIAVALGVRDDAVMEPVEANDGQEEHETASA